MTPPLSATVNWTPTNVRFWPKADLPPISKMGVFIAQADS